MRNLTIIFILALCVLSCSKKEDKIQRNHEILNVILADRIKLEKHNFIFTSKEDTIKDSIRIRKLELIGKSFIGFQIDTVNKLFGIFDHLFLTDKPKTFGIPTDSLLNQIKRLKSTNWDSNLLTTNILIDRKQDVNDVDLFNPLLLDKSYLIISEPISITENKVVVSAKILSYRYSLDRFYTLERKQGKWEIIKRETMVCKQVEDKSKRQAPDKDGWESKTYYGIFRGYSYSF